MKIGLCDNFISRMTTTSIQCPTCWENFEVSTPPEDERPCEMDYDCEVCCRPLLIICNPGEDCYAQGLSE